MSNDVTYGVVVQFDWTQRGSVSQIIGGAKSATDSWLKDATGKVANFAGSAANAFNSAFDGIASSVVSGLTTAGALGGAAFAIAVGGALKEGLNFGAYIEGSVNGMAATMSMLGDIPLDKGIVQANKSIENLRKAAATLPGELKDAVGVMSAILPVGLNNHVGMDRLEKLAAQGVAVSASLGIGQHVAARELADLLGGRAKSSQPLTNRLGIHASEWNKQDAATRFSKVETLFGKMDPAMKNFQGSWEGMTSTIKDNARNVAKTFAAPLFGSLKGEMSRSLEWFAGNEDKVQAFAQNLGIYVDRAFHFGLDAIHRWSGPVMAFGHTLHNALSRGFSVVGPYLDKLERVALGFMSDPTALSKLGHVASSLVALRAGTGVLGMGMGNMGGIMSGLETAGVGAGELAMAAPWAAAGILGLALAAEGAVHSLTDGSSAFHGAAVGIATDIGAHSAHAALELAHLDQSTRGARDALGAFALSGVGVAATSFDLVITGASKVGDAFSGLSNLGIRAGEALRNMLGLLHKDGPDPMIDRPMTYTGFGKASDAPAERETEKIAPPKVHQTINQTFTVEVKTDGDMQRIAAVFDDKIFPAWERRMRNKNANPLAHYSQ